MISGILIGIVFLTPYMFSPFWKFLPATAGLFISAKLFWKDSWRAHLGVEINKRQLSISVVAGLLFYFPGTILIPHLLEAVGGAFNQSQNLIWRISPFFQALNEELVLRALLLSQAIKIFKGNFRTSIIVAVVFGILHWILYRYNLQSQVVLKPLTMFNLILFGLICNELYLKFRHIGFGLAIHAGWNLTRFTGDFWIGQKLVSEGETFNIIEGSFWMTGILILAFMIVWIFGTYFGTSPVFSDRQ